MRTTASEYRPELERVVRELMARFARTITLAHARCVELYRNKYQAKQNGTIGVTLVSHLQRCNHERRADG